MVLLNPISYILLVAGFPVKGYHTRAWMVEGGGFEPPKAWPTDLQSVPFDRSGTPPNVGLNIHSFSKEPYNPSWIQPNLTLAGASEGIRTPDQLITNQSLYRLSYAGRIAPKQSFKYKSLKKNIQYIFSRPLSLLFRTGRKT